MFMIMQSKIMSGEVPKDKVIHVDQEASVIEASKLMRKSDATELLVTAEVNGMLFPLGIVTAKDIVTRVIAAELDPVVLTIGDIAWSGIAAAGSGDIAVRLRRSQEDPCGTLAVLDGDGRLIGKVELDEVMGTRPQQPGTT